MDVITIAFLVLAILALGGWGYGYLTAVPVPGRVAGNAPGPALGITLLGIIGLILLVAYLVLLATRWRFELDL
jgi:hypothetical protein